jgi:hypothetical protein
MSWNVSLFIYYLRAPFLIYAESTLTNLQVFYLTGWNLRINGWPGAKPQAKGTGVEVNVLTTCVIHQLFESCATRL